MHYIVALLAAWIGFGRGSRPAAGAGRFRSGRRVETAQDLIDVMDEVHRRIEERWNAWFLDRFELPMQTMVFEYIAAAPDGEPVTVVTTCVDADHDPIPISSNDPNALFCQCDPNSELDCGEISGVVYIPIEPLHNVLSGNIWNTKYPLRDEADIRDQLVVFAATLVAHESGHGVQRAYEWQTGNGAPTDKNREQFADCVAGDLIALIESDLCSQPIDPDLTKAIRTAGFAAIGDLVAPDDENVPINRAMRFQTHGFGEQRLFAFEKGYKNANVLPDRPSDICFERYWPDFAG